MLSASRVPGQVCDCTVLFSTKSNLIQVYQLLGIKLLTLIINSQQKKCKIFFVLNENYGGTNYCPLYAMSAHDELQSCGSLLL